MFWSHPFLERELQTRLNHCVVLAFFHSCVNGVEFQVQILVEEIVKTNDWIRKDVQQALRDNLEVLDKKKRTINYFTIAFMGRTKAGKSTFHKVVTHEEDDDIGVGKLRTTRYNRSFYWENLRIVDTPGIGAPGGKTDTETASSIIDEAVQTRLQDLFKVLYEKCSVLLFCMLSIRHTI